MTTVGNGFFLRQDLTYCTYCTRKGALLTTALFFGPKADRHSSGLLARKKLLDDGCCFNTFSQTGEYAEDIWTGREEVQVILFRPIASY